MGNDLISIVVPVYNVENYISECIESVINQSYQNWELILINDGSTDNSVNICKKYLSDDRITLYDNYNFGLAYSRQYGFDRAKGEFICSIDSDDFISPDMLKKMYEQICRYEADICVCGRVDFNNKNVRKPFPILEKEQMVETHVLTPNDYFDWIVKLHASDTWDKMYRKSFLDKVGIVFSMPKHLNGTDSSFNYMLMLHEPRYAIVCENLYFHRILNFSKAHRKNKDLQKSFQIITRQLLDECKKIGNYTLKVSCVYKLYCELMYSALVDICIEVSNFAEIRKRIKLFMERHYVFFHNECPEFKELKNCDMTYFNGNEEDFNTNYKKLEVDMFNLVIKTKIHYFLKRKKEL